MLSIPERRLSRQILLAVLWTALCFLPLKAAAQEAPAVRYLRYDVDIVVQADGTLSVVETQEIQFGERFESGFAELPLAFTSGIEAVSVTGALPGTVTAQPEGEALILEWDFPPTTAGDVRTFAIGYRVLGGLWVYRDGVDLEWRAVPADRGGVPVESSRVTVTWPEPVPAGELFVFADGPEYRVAVTPRSATFDSAEPVADGTAFRVQVGLPPGPIQAQVQPWQIAEDQADLVYRQTALDVVLSLDESGDLWVEESHYLTVDAGALHGGERSMPMIYLSDISEIAVAEGDQPFVAAGAGEVAAGCVDCFAVERRERRSDWVTYSRRQNRMVITELYAGQVTVAWQIPALVRGESTSIHFRYRAQGALQHGPDGQRLRWTAVFPQRETAVQQATLTLRLPPGVDPEEVAVEGYGPRVLEDGALFLEHDGPLQPRESWTVSVLLPQDATAAPIPDWQQELEAVLAQEAEIQVRQTRETVLLTVFGLLFLLSGLSAFGLIWYREGRDHPVPFVADYLTEPPSQLPPAIVAYLLDEEPSPRAVMASLLHLANLGLLAVRFEPALHFTRLRDEELAEGEVLTTPDGNPVTVPDYLPLLFNGLREQMPTGREVALGQVQPVMPALLPQVYAEMADETELFFDQEPAAARRRWMVLSQWVVLAGLGCALLLAWRWWQDHGALALFPGGGLALAGLFGVFLSRFMPQRTNAGAEEAQRWRAFARYLRNLQHYAGVEEAQTILDRYFAYAVALGVEEIVLAQAADLAARPPIWIYTGEAPTSLPRQDPRPGSGGRPPGPTSVPSPGTAPGPGGLPSLSALSRQMGRGLRDASRSLGQTLSLAAGDRRQTTPFQVILRGVGKATQLSWQAGTSTTKVLGDILEASSSGGGSSSHRSSSAGSSWGSSSGGRRAASSGMRRSASSFGSSRSSGRSSTSRRSGGGGRRGFR